MPREYYLLDGINCEPFLFPVECREVNNSFHKNQTQNEILYHHFIVSFDPKDAADYDLTPERAHDIAKEWAEKCIPGFQILACTHTDGHNESGNIHTHLYVNSVRKHDTEEHAYGERSIDHKAGYKLHMTNGYMEFMKGELMHICERENLHQVDLLEKSTHHVTDREYYAQKRGQEKLDVLVAEMETDGITPVHTDFQTTKEKIRQAIDDVIGMSKSFEEFQYSMKQEYGIAVKESRGRWSYLPEGREKYIAGRSLGTAYEKESLEKRYGEYFTQPLHASTKNSYEFVETRISQSITDEMDCHMIFHDDFLGHTKPRLVVDIQTCAKALESSAYAHKVQLTNLKAMADTILFLQNNQIESVSSLDDLYQLILKKEDSLSTELKEVKENLELTNEQVHYVGQYYANKAIYERASTTNDSSYSDAHKTQIVKYQEGLAYVEKNFGIALSNLSVLKENRERLIAQRNELQKAQKALYDQKKCLGVMIHNVDEILGLDNMK